VHAIRLRIGRAIRRSPWFAPLLRWEHPYDQLSDFAARLPPVPPAASGQTSRSREAVIAYVLWRYPTPSETFIRREIQALRAAGVRLDVLAEGPWSPPMTPDPVSPAGEVAYFGATDVESGRAAALHWLRRRPGTLLRVWLFLVAHRYPNPTKTWWRDRDLLFRGARLALLLRSRGVTHVHAPWANQYAIVTYVAAVLAGITYSVQARASEIHRTYESGAVADRLRTATFVVTNSQYNQRHLQELLGPNGPPIHLVYNGVERHWLEETLEPADGGVCRIVAVGRLIEPKGFRYLLDACDRLRNRGVPFSCDIIGAPSEPLDTATWVDLRIALTRRQLHSHVRFLGGQPLTVVRQALRRADAFVLPCVRGRDGSHDITPNSILEAMAMGIAVVSTTSGAVPELVEAGRTGLLVAPNDAAALAEALECLAANPALRQQLGAAARERVRERFDVDRNAQARIRLFQAVAKGTAVS
jgi:colanic acid/amylovoran biosynthesis glycosyltransferase